MLANFGIGAKQVFAVWVQAHRENRVTEGVAHEGGPSSITEGVASWMEQALTLQLNASRFQLGAIQFSVWSSCELSEIFSGIYFGSKCS